MNRKIYNEYVTILESELVPALGCTEPIALAYAAAKAKEVLGKMPDHITMRCSGNIIKNVKGVKVPNSGGMKGVEAAAVLGITGGDPSQALEVLEHVTDREIDEAEKLFRQTGCDAVMIGRAVEGNPWIFREMNHYFATGEELARPSLAEVKAMILKHARAQIEMKGEFIGIREMRKHVAWYTAGMPHSAGLRRESNNIESYADLEKLLERL